MVTSDRYVYTCFMGKKLRFNWSLKLVDSQQRARGLVDKFGYLICTGIYMFGFFFDVMIFRVL